MANHWDLSDVQLTEMLTNWFQLNLEHDLDGLEMRLFKNNFEPQPGTDLSDFVQADFPGYTLATLFWGSWADVTVAGNVASTLYDDFISYTAGSSGFSSQTIYGYYLVGTGEVLKWSESFAEVITVVPGYTFSVKPQMKLKTLPNPL